MQKNKREDFFAAIASAGIGDRGAGLVTSTPPVLEDKTISLSGIQDGAAFEPTHKMSTPEELNQALAQSREEYGCFLQNLAPSLESRRERLFLDEFDWKTDDLGNPISLLDAFTGAGAWERVKIPHFGGPLGKARTYYRTEFNLNNDFFTLGAAFVCFRGVDYKAYVFLNGHFLGSHEGFFAPFEFDAAQAAKPGRNILVVQVENDFICMGSESESSDGRRYVGDKIYAATGLGYDDPQFGWHHCPPGMGICQDVFIESRPRLFIKNLFVRPLEDLESAEAWVELYSCDVEPKEASLRISVFGQNFESEVFRDLEFTPSCALAVGLGDTFTESKLRAEGKLGVSLPMLMDKGLNLLKIPMKIPGARRWEPSAPWLYQLQASLFVEGKVADTSARQFGMRTFQMDCEGSTKGSFYLNGKPLRLRGANTMGHEQQCVFKKDFDQLIDDILLAKLCNMNYLRLTQRPVQEEVYEYCDRLGLMTQTDLPLFAVLASSQFCEAVRQAEEMERLVRPHPCNITVSYINEPLPNAGNKSNRNLTRDELESFFKAADCAVHLANPDRVIKYVDGDYDPPSNSLPDSHCYPAWYNGHGIDIGRLHRGYWMPVKPDWYFGCGEFGAEGLDPVAVMKKYYPSDWLPSGAEAEKTWSPCSIHCAQTGNFHYMFFDTPDTLDGWVSESQRHQAWAARFMTEAFRRNSGMVSFAIHLFIDAFPSGWMKAIMDCERTPKPAYFEYRNALAPVLPNLRTDRFSFFAGEKIRLEAWACNDTAETLEHHVLYIQAELSGKVLSAAKLPAEVPACSSRFQGFVSFTAPQVQTRTPLCVRIALMDTEGNTMNDTSVDLEIFPNRWEEEPPAVEILDSEDQKGTRLVSELYPAAVGCPTASCPVVIVVCDFDQFRSREKDIWELVENGATLLFLELPAGEYSVLGSAIRVKNAGMLPMHFASRATGHPLVAGFQKDDFRLWYDPDQDCISPILDATFTAEGYDPVLVSGNVGENGAWGPALAAAEKLMGRGCVRICQVKLSGRVMDNPIAWEFATRLFGR
jgi:hypothetical protein